MSIYIAFIVRADLFIFILLSVFQYLIWDKCLFFGTETVCWCVLTVILWLADCRIHLWSSQKCYPSWNERRTSSSNLDHKGNEWDCAALQQLTARGAADCTFFIMKIHYLKHILIYVTICVPVKKIFSKIRLPFNLKQYLSDLGVRT